MSKCSLVTACLRASRRVFIMQGQQEKVLAAFKRVNVPVESIMEAEETTQATRRRQPLSEAPESTEKYVLFTVKSASNSSEGSC